MATKCVDYYSRIKLNCGDCVPASAILCVPPEILEPTDAAATDGFLNATVTFASFGVESCGGTLYHYRFEYDDADLIEGVTLLTSQINGAFCSDCFVEWITSLSRPTIQITTLTTIEESCFEVTAGVTVFTSVTDEACCILTDYDIGERVVISGLSATPAQTFFVHPPDALSQIGILAADTPIEISSQGTIELMRVSTTQWIVVSLMEP